MADREDVGGPEEIIDRIGVLKSVCCCPDGPGDAIFSSGADEECSRDDIRPGRRGVGPDPCEKGTGLDEVPENVHDEDCESDGLLSEDEGNAFMIEDEGVLRSARRPCKACEETSGTSSSDGDMVIRVSSNANLELNSSC